MKALTGLLIISKMIRLMSVFENEHKKHNNNNEMEEMHKTNKQTLL